jgi:hypothetical protein
MRENVDESDAIRLYFALSSGERLESVKLWGEGGGGNALRLAD